MTREYVEWQGPGWYGSVQTGHHESTAIGWFRYSGEFNRDGYSPDGEERIWDRGRREGLGTPRWLNSATEL